MQGFRITGSKGFHITFENGCTVSVQFGPGNYGTNYHMDFSELDRLASAGKDMPKSATAEIAAWDENKHWWDFEKKVFSAEGCDVIGYKTPAEVLAVINDVANFNRPNVQETK